MELGGGRNSIQAERSAVLVHTTEVHSRNIEEKRQGSENEAELVNERERKERRGEERASKEKKGEKAIRRLQGCSVEVDVAGASKIGVAPNPRKKAWHQNKLYCQRDTQVDQGSFQGKVVLFSDPLRD
ncbi:unnamed protein product [Coregonus sp. 'balchen']|nr:unnamed protein product [Coregonus sp. 'balchen']